MVLAYTLAWQQLAFNNVFSVSDTVFVNGQAGSQLHSLTTDGTGNGQLVEAQGSGRRLKASCDFDCRVHTDANGNGKGFSKSFSLFTHSAQVTCTGSEEHGDFILALQAQAVNGYIGFAGFYIVRIAHAQGDVRAGILRSIGRSRNQLTNIKALILSAIHNLLALGLLSTYNNRVNGIFNGVAQQEAQIFGFRIEQSCYTLAVGQHADNNLGTGMTFNIGKHHGRAGFGRTGYSSASAYMAIYASQLSGRVNLHISANQLSGNFFQSS